MWHASTLSLLHGITARFYSDDFLANTSSTIEVLEEYCHSIERVNECSGGMWTFEQEKRNGPIVAM